MKGLVFVELLNMAEVHFGEDIVDEVLDGAALPSGGAYTKIGYYDCSELVTLVDAFSKHAGVDSKRLEQSFGHWVMDSFYKGFPDFFLKYPTAPDMLAAIENDIHIEVLKLYPDAELPTIDVVRTDEHSFTVCYASERPLAHFCLGLIEGCFRKYEEEANITLKDSSSGGTGKALIEVKTK